MHKQSVLQIGQFHQRLLIDQVSILGVICLLSTHSLPHQGAIPGPPIIILIIIRRQEMAEKQTNDYFILN